MLDAGSLSSHRSYENFFNPLQLFRLNFSITCAYVELYRILIKSLYAALHSAATVFSVSSGIWQNNLKKWQGQREAEKKVKTSQEKKGLS